MTSGIVWHGLSRGWHSFFTIYNFHTESGEGHSFIRFYMRIIFGCVCFQIHPPLPSVSLSATHEVFSKGVPDFFLNKARFSCGACCWSVKQILHILCGPSLFIVSDCFAHHFSTVRCDVSVGLICFPGVATQRGRAAYHRLTYRLFFFLSFYARGCFTSYKNNFYCSRLLVVSCFEGGPETLMFFCFVF